MEQKGQNLILMKKKGARKNNWVNRLSNYEIYVLWSFITLFVFNLLAQV